MKAELFVTALTHKAGERIQVSGLHIGLGAQ